MIGVVTIPFRNIFADELKMPAATILTLIDTCRESKQTGMLRLLAEGGGMLYLLLKSGAVINSYIVSSKTLEPALSDQWAAWLDAAGGAHVRLIPLSSLGLLMCKLLIQNSVGKTEVLARSVDLDEYLKSQKKVPDVSLVQLDWENSMGAALFSGESESPYSLYVSSETLYDQLEIAPTILNPQRLNCTATVFCYDPSLGAWQEYLLRRVFANICERTLSRFQMVTGRSLVDSLIRLTLAFASRQNLNIGISSYKVVDGEIFSSPDKAAIGYRLLLTEMFSHFSGITGTRLLSSTLREIVAELPVQERAIVDAFSLLSEGYVYDRRT